MQVEGPKNPSNGRLTTSLIAPIAKASPPKFRHNSNVPGNEVYKETQAVNTDNQSNLVFLGSEQNGNGRISHRIGLSLPVGSNIELDDLQELLKVRDVHSIASIQKTNEHIHAYIESVGKDGETFYTHLTIENRKDGLVACEIAAFNGDQTGGVLRGFLKSHNVGSSPTINTHEPFVVEFESSGIDTHQIDLGTIRKIEIELGCIDRNGPNYITHRQDGSLKIFSKEIDLELDPFQRFPVTTLPQSELAWRFPGTRSDLRLAPEVAVGNVFSSPPLSSGRTL